MITISVLKRIAKAASIINIPTGNVNSIPIKFAFAEDTENLWQNVKIIAVFNAVTPKGRIITAPAIVDEENAAYIPGVVLSVPGSKISAGLEGYIGDDKVITTNLAIIATTIPGASSDGMKISEDGMSEIQTVLDIQLNLKKDVLELKDSLSAATEDAERYAASAVEAASAMADSVQRAAEAAERAEGSASDASDSAVSAKASADRAEEIYEDFDMVPISNLQIDLLFR